MTLPPFFKVVGLIVGLPLAAAVTATSARAELRDETAINDAIIDIGIAYEISEQCRSIAARTLSGIFMLNQLKDDALALGYSEDEIDAYVHDRTEKRRLIAIARERLAALGAVEGQASTYCEVGRAQMAEGTRVGSLLR